MKYIKDVPTVVSLMMSKSARHPKINGSQLDMLS